MCVCVCLFKCLKIKIEFALKKNVHKRSTEAIAIGIFQHCQNVNVMHANHTIACNFSFALFERNELVTISVHLPIQRMER